MKTLLIGALLGAGLPLLVALAIGLSGRVNVAATQTDPAPLAWFLHTAFERSVARHASDIEVPADLGDRERIVRGARSFAAMCAGCHTPPGLTDTPRASGLNPAPPPLSELIGHHDAAETFWVIRNGVRMTGMPAFSPSHEDAALWDLTAFVEAADGLSAQAYAVLSAGPVDDGHDHRHGDAPTGHGSDGGHDDHGAELGHGDHAHADVIDIGSETPPERIVDAYHAALRAGDEATVLALLRPTARIFESGRVEASRDEYRSHHLKADLQAAKGIEHRVLERTVTTRGDAAWVMSRTHVTGHFRDQAVDRAGTETMTLLRTAEGWRIDHIHWSFGAAPKSAAKPPPAGHEGHDHDH